MKTCNYHRLIAELAYYDTGEWKTDVETCPQPPAQYVCVTNQSGDTEIYRNVCAEHGAAVRTLPTWRWSRPKAVA